MMNYGRLLFMRFLTTSLVCLFLVGTVIGANIPQKCPKVIRIGVIDSGFGKMGMFPDTRLCRYGHRDFTGNVSFGGFDTVTPVPIDNIGHGTNIAGLIDQEARKGGDSYCLVIIKYLHDKKKAYFMQDALKYAKNLRLDIVNISAGGYGIVDEEYNQIEGLLNQGTLITAAAGNDSRHLSPFNHPDKNHYPASYDPRIMVVGNGTDKNYRAPSSNYGPIVKFWEDGRNKTALGITQSGTSQATAIFTGKLVANKLRSCDN